MSYLHRCMIHIGRKCMFCSEIHLVSSSFHYLLMVCFDSLLEFGSPQQSSAVALLHNQENGHMLDRECVYELVRDARASPFCIVMNRCSF